METDAKIKKEGAEIEVKQSKTPTHCLTLQVQHLHFRYETQHPMSASTVHRHFLEYLDHLLDRQRVLNQRKRIASRHQAENRPLTEIEDQIYKTWNEQIQNIENQLHLMVCAVCMVSEWGIDDIWDFGVKCCDGKCDNVLNKKTGNDQG
ncbi:MAG: hypothetical protein Q9174_005864 [Haloplaca sp. 1 TL-2023]